MPLRKSTRIWLIIFAAALLLSLVIERTERDSGCLGLFVKSVAITAGFVLAWRVIAAAFRVIVRRLTLRLAFSYFLIGIVPIPLLAALLSLVAYLVAHQYMANRLRREVTAVGEEAVRSDPTLPVVRADGTGKIARSPVPWLNVGEPAPWLEDLERPGFLVSDSDVWLAVRRGAEPAAALLLLTDPATPWLQELADRTGYTVSAQRGERDAKGPSIRIEPGPRKKLPGGAGVPDVHPRARPVPGKGFKDSEWVHAFYLETAVNAVGEKAETGENVAVLAANTSPRVLFDQLFFQGVAEIGRIFWAVLLAVAGALLIVYLVALAIAFVLVGSIARNVNRLTRAAEAIARGDFSVRVNSKSRDQIGDLARSFDGMAASIQRLLVETALKERLESEIAMARTIQHKLLPPAEARFPGFSVHAHFEPVAEIGGDYYDYLPIAEGRTAVALGDVSGHGLPTGLLVAMAKAALSTLLEAGHRGGELFGRLNELIHRSTEPRHYMTLALLDYDAATRKGVLTNAGQLAPYRVSGKMVEALSLPSLPLGLFPAKTFPTREFPFASGDILVFLTDGFVEAVDAHDEAFGFDRLEELLQTHASSGAAAVRDALLAAVREHTGASPPDDDRTLVLLTLD